MAERNSDVPRDRRIEFRVGINLGDIIIDESEHIRRRRQCRRTPRSPGRSGRELCQPDGARPGTRQLLVLSFEDMGEQQVKNIARPVRAYRVVTDAGVRVAATAAQRRRRWTPRRAIAASIAALVLLATGAIGATAFWRLYPP